MNRLRYSRVYLSGAMDRVKDGGIPWRNDLKPFLNSRGTIVIDPTNKPKCLLGNCPVESPESRAEAAKLKSEGRFDEFKEFMRVKAAVCARTDGVISEYFFSAVPVPGYEFIEYNVLNEAEVREIFDSSGFTEIKKQGE